MKCQFCGKPAEFLANERVYGQRYGKSYMMWRCDPCDAHVGVHNNDPQRPLGYMATKKLRELRKKAHEHFDPLWSRKRGNVAKHRVEMYKELSEYFGKEVHIGEANTAMCNDIIKWCKKKRNNEL